MMDMVKRCYTIPDIGRQVGILKGVNIDQKNCFFFLINIYSHQSPVDDEHHCC